MKNLFRRKPGVDPGAPKERILPREPFVERWADRLASENHLVQQRAIAEAIRVRNTKALQTLFGYVKSDGYFAAEAIDAICLIIRMKPGDLHALDLVPIIEKNLCSGPMEEDIWIFSALTQANPGLFSSLAPLLIELLGDCVEHGEDGAMKEIVIALGNIGNKEAILPLERLRKYQIDEETEMLVDEALHLLKTKNVYVN